MRILVSFALETEFAPWRRLRPFARVEGLGFAAHDGKVGSAEVRIILTGVGAAHAKSVIANALQGQPDVCISSGLAGSLRSMHPVGLVFAAREVMELESGRTITTNQELVTAAEKRGIRVVERMLSSSNIVVTAEGKGRLGRMAEAVEMESFAVLAEAAAHKVPAIAIRAISDAADEDLPMDFSGVLDSDGKVHGLKAVRALAGAPHKLPALLRLGRNSRCAAKKLAEFLDVYIQDLAMQQDRGVEKVEATA